MDPATGTVMWDGRSWNIQDNQVFEAAFEKYLNAPTAESEKDKAYRQVMDEMLAELSPHRPGGPSMPGAVALLPRAASFPIDARLSDSLAQTIYGVWQAQKNVGAIRSQVERMKKDRKGLARNARISAQPRTLAPPEEKKGKNNNSAESQLAKWGETAILVKDIAEIEATMKVLQGEMAVSLPLRKIEYQALIVQFFLQRRFEHCILACRIYRQLFRDGDSSLHIEEGSEIEKIFSGSLGVSPTINTLDTASNEALRHIQEAVEAFYLLVEHEEYESASKRLSEAFMTGEFCGPVRTVPLEQKRKVLGFVRDSHQLRNALEVKDFELAEDVVNQMRTTARDFDYSKPFAMIETARTVANLHLDKAKLAASQGDMETVTTELRAATEIWPRNPKLKQVSEMITGQGDIRSQAIFDFDRLIAQRNHRQIFNDQGRYAGALLDDPARQEQLREVITDVTRINMVAASAREMSQAGQDAAAWESIRRAADEFPDDSEINKMLSEMTTKVASFVQAIERASKLEQRGQFGSSLAWFLKARRQHPGSTLAEAGIGRVVDALRPGGEAGNNSEHSQEETGDSFEPGEFGKNSSSGDDGFDSF